MLANNFDFVFIETVGAGQSEMRCAAVANRIVVVEGPVREMASKRESRTVGTADLIVVTIRLGWSRQGS